MLFLEDVSQSNIAVQPHRIDEIVEDLKDEDEEGYESSEVIEDERTYEHEHRDNNVAHSLNSHMVVEQVRWLL